MAADSPRGPRELPEGLWNGPTSDNVVPKTPLLRGLHAEGVRGAGGVTLEARGITPPQMRLVGFKPSEDVRRGIATCMRL